MVGGGGGWHSRIESLQVLLTFDFRLLTWTRTWTWIVTIICYLSYLRCLLLTSVVDMKGDVTVDGLLVLIINGVDCVVGLTVEVNK